MCKEWHYYKRLNTKGCERSIIKECGFGKILESLNNVLEVMPIFAL